jgi:hypothetical protein
MPSKTWTIALNMSKKTRRLILKENLRNRPKMTNQAKSTTKCLNSMRKKRQLKPKRLSSEINSNKKVDRASKVRFSWDTMITLPKKPLRMRRVSNNSTTELTKMMKMRMNLMSKLVFKLIHSSTMISKQMLPISLTNIEYNLKINYLRKE